MRRARAVGPIVVGGVGGSGTRVVAQLLLAIRCDLGNDLTVELDDALFNLLFYRPSWVGAVLGGDSADVGSGLDLMHARAHGCRRLTRRQTAFVHGAWSDVVRDGHFGGRVGGRAASGAWAIRRLWRFLRSGSQSRQQRSAWGWKEPTAHFFADHIVDHFLDARYVHVIRHGLDMAYSGNDRQVRRFGSVFGVDLDGRPPTPQDMLRYWIRANRRVVDGVCASMPARAHVVVFEELCARPAGEIRRLLDFLGMRVDPSAMDTLAGIPKRPRSVGRHRAIDTSMFDDADLDDVARLGFRV